MRVVERHGSSVLDYRGVCNISVSDSNTRVHANGYFEVAQFESGRLVVGVVPTKIPKPTRIEIRNRRDTELSFTGETLDNWILRTTGDTFFSRVPWLLLPLAAARPSELSFGAQYLEACRSGASQERYSMTKFLIGNMLWHHKATEKPEPIRLKARDYEITVTCVDGYQDVAQRLAHGHGIEPTAWVCIESPDGKSERFSCFRDLMDDLTHLFRLVTGNLVDWYYGEAYDPCSERPVERVHKHTTPTSFSNTVRFENRRTDIQYLFPKLDLCELAMAFFDQSGHVLDTRDLKTLINHFTTACGDSIFFESSGLLASTLIELIVAKKAETNDSANLLTKSKYRAHVLPALKQAVMRLNVPCEVQHGIVAYLTGGHRKSFRQKLESLMHECDLPLIDRDVNLIVHSRNALVHAGTFQSRAEDGGWRNDYGVMVWTALVALCRLLGYQGELPERRDGQTIVV